MNTKFFAKLANLGMVSSMLFSLGLQASPALALPPKTNLSNVTNLSLQAKEKAAKCLNSLQSTISASPQPVELWDTAILSWNVTVPSTSALCTGINVKLSVDGLAVSPTGNRSIQPIADYKSILIASSGTTQRTLATTDVKVNLPLTVTIDANNLTPLFLQALRTPDTYIDVKNHVELDLSGRESIPIAQEVTLAGGRTAREPGPLLYTTTRPKVLFYINGDNPNVKITGVRIEGPDHSRVVPEDEESDKGVGIKIDGSINIEIAHNEIYGWSQSAIRVDDCERRWCPDLPNGKMSPSENPNMVRIHDNYIHHNQHVGKNGYGVAVYDGAYALIERNVFDWNRHAIAGDGSPGTGYAAYRNLVLKNGGYHDTYNACDIPNWVLLLPSSAGASAAAAKALCLVGVDPSYTHYTHQFDMHGTETCGLGHLDCGDAGHSMFIRHNTFLYTAGNAIKLRGIPEDGMYIGANVFAHNNWEDAVVATEKIGIYAEPGNERGVDASTDLGVCDFDGDGLNDTFMATGATWWFSSGGDRPWEFLNTSTRRRAEVTLGQCR